MLKAFIHRGLRVVSGSSGSRNANLWVGLTFSIISQDNNRENTQ